MPGDVPLYDKSYFDGTHEINFIKEGPFFAARFRDRLRRLSKHAARGKLLDIGCATGNFLEVAKDAGWNAEGIEISDYAASIACKKGFKVFPNIEICCAQDTRYDAVTMWHFLEHIADPRSIAAQIYNLLKPGGVLAIEVPDAGSKPAMRQRENWHFVKPPEHIYYFDKHTLSKLLELAGFLVLESVQLPWGTGMAEKAQKIGFGIGAKIKSTLRAVPGMAKLRDWMIRHLAEPEVLLMIASKSR